MIRRENWNKTFFFIIVIH